MYIGISISRASKGSENWAKKSKTKQYRLPQLANRRSFHLPDVEWENRFLLFPSLVWNFWRRKKRRHICTLTTEALPGVVSLVWMNLKMFRVAVLSLFISLYLNWSKIACPCRNLSFSIRVVVCRDFILCAAATFWAMSLVRIYPDRASLLVQCIKALWCISVFT